MNNQGDKGSHATRKAKTWIPPQPLPAHLSPVDKLIYDQRLRHSEGYNFNNTHSSPYGALNASPIGSGQANPYSTLWFPSTSAKNSNVGLQFPVYLPAPPPAHQNALLQRSLFHHVPDNAPFTCFPRTTFPNLADAHLYISSVASWIGEEEQKHAAIMREMKVNMNGSSWPVSNGQFVMGPSMLESRKLDVPKNEPLNDIESTAFIGELGGGNGSMSIGPPVLSSGSNSNRRLCVKSDLTDGKGNGVRRFECLTCGKRFSYKSVLKNHERIHTRERPFQCVVCNRKFSRDHHLVVHTRLHTGERPFKCPECDRRFVQETSVRQHVRIHSDPRIRQYNCTHCSSSFRYFDQLKRHFVVHSDIKLFHCVYCGEGYVRQINLLKHMYKCAKDGGAKGKNPTHPNGAASTPIFSSPSQVNTNTAVSGTIRQSEVNDNLTGESTRVNEEKCRKRERKCCQPRHIIRVDGRPVVVKPCHVTPIISDLTDSLPVHNPVSVEDHPHDLSFVNCTIRVVGPK